MDSDLIRFSEQGAEKVRTEREEWAFSEAERRIRAHHVAGQLPCADPFIENDPHAQLVKEALLYGYCLGFDHAYGALKSEEVLPRSRKVEETIIAWLKETPDMPLSELCDNTHLGRRRSRGQRRLFNNIPLAPTRSRRGAFWGDRLRQLATERTNATFDAEPYNPWIAWQLAPTKNERIELRARLETWVAKLRRKAKILVGGEQLLASGAEYITKEAVPWYREPSPIDDVPWPDE